MGNGFVLGDFRQGQRVYISHVHRDVDHAHREHAQNHRQGHTAPRLSDLARHPRDVYPPVVGPEDGNQSDPHRRN